MKTTPLLDYDLNKEWEGYVFHTDDILWTGKANPEFKISFLEKDYYHDVVTSVVSGTFIYTVSVLTLAAEIYHRISPGGAIAVCILAIILPFGYEYFKYQNRLKTQYAITKSYVLYKVFNGFTWQVKTIPLENILSAQLLDIKEEKGTGSILLITQNIKGLSQFRKKYSIGEFHPALENVYDYEAGFALLSRLVANYPQKPLAYKAPIISQYVYKPVKVIMAFTLVFMSIYLIDFFVLPTYMVMAHVAEMNAFEATEGSYGSAYLGSSYTTRNGKTFFLDNHFTAVQTEKLQIHLTPIFDIVKKVKTPENDYSHTLESSLHSTITRVAYLLTYLAVFIGTYQLSRRKKIEVELFWKNISGAIVFMYVLYIAWMLNN